MNDEAQVRLILDHLARVNPRSARMLHLLCSYCTADVEWDTSQALADGRVYRGRNGVARFFGEWLRSWTDWSWQPVDIFTEGDLVVVLVREQAVSLRGVRLDHVHRQEWTLRGGKLAAWAALPATIPAVAA